MHESNLVILTPTDSDSEDQRLLMGVFGTLNKENPMNSDGSYNVYIDPELASGSAFLNVFSEQISLRVQPEEAFILRSSNSDSFNPIKATLASALAVNWKRQYGQGFQRANNSITSRMLTDERNKAIAATERVIESSGCKLTRQPILFLGGLVDEDLLTSIVIPEGAYFSGIDPKAAITSEESEEIMNNQLSPDDDGFNSEDFLLFFGELPVYVSEVDGAYSLMRDLNTNNPRVFDFIVRNSEGVFNPQYETESVEVAAEIALSMARTGSNAILSEYLQQAYQAKKETNRVADPLP